MSRLPRLGLATQCIIFCSPDTVFHNPHRASTLAHRTLCRQDGRSRARRGNSVFVHRKSMVSRLQHVRFLMWWLSHHNIIKLISKGGFIFLLIVWRLSNEVMQQIKRASWQSIFVMQCLWCNGDKRYRDWGDCQSK